MPKRSPLSWERPTRPIHTKEFTDPLHPDEPITLSLRAVDALDGHLALGIQEEYVQLYITGTAEQEPATFPFIGGESMQISEKLFENVANLYAMQAQKKQDGSENDERYSFEEIVALSVTAPTIWSKILLFAHEVESDYQKKIQKPLKEPTATK